VISFRNILVKLEAKINIEILDDLIKATLTKIDFSLSNDIN